VDKLISVTDLSRKDIYSLFEEAKAMEEVLGRKIPKVPVLTGKRIALVFLEPSTRTRLSFELAGKALSADTIHFSPDTSSLKKGEGWIETIETLQSLGVDGMVIRSPWTGFPHFVYSHLKIPVINGGDGIGEHPTQALLDIYTLYKERGSVEGMTLLIVGDIHRSRVARSHMHLSSLLGYRILLCAPQTFLPRFLPEGVETVPSIEEGIEKADAILVLRIQKERFPEEGPFFSTDEEYYLTFGVRKVHFKKRTPYLLHPGPANLTVEIDPELYWGYEKTLIRNQVRCGVAIRMALLYEIFSR